jgi:tetratricopeptide (TPR) repeat protein
LLTLLKTSIILFRKNQAYKHHMASIILTRGKQSAGVISYLILCAFALAAVPSGNFAQGENDETSRPANTFAPLMSGVVSDESARVLILTENISSAILVYAQLLAVDSTDSAKVPVSAEYAYALALAGIYDAALIRLDRIWGRKGIQTESSYFASQVFALMGHDQLAGEFWKESEKKISPAWISSKAPVLLQKYKRGTPEAAPVNREELVTRFKHANKLAAQGSNLQSIALFEEIITQYPGEYLPYVGYSIVLEKTGLLEKSAKTIETALAAVGDDPEQTDTKQFLDQRLAFVRKEIDSLGHISKSAGLRLKGAGGNNNQFIVYAGGMVATNYFGLNSRLGYFLTESGNIAFDLGVSSNSGSTLCNLGFSYYHRYKICIAGCGLTGSFGSSGSPPFYFKLSPGFSILNSKKTASLDIFVDEQIPITQGLANTLGISVGRSVYFGKRK